MFKKKRRSSLELGQATKPNSQSWIKRHKRLSIVLGVALVILIAGAAVATVVYLNRNTPDQPAASTQPPEPPEPTVYYSPLTGSEVKSEAASKQAVTAVMIENSPDARPQSGLKQSGVVFEAIAEGGITRFLVLYQEQKPELVGPVRSVRMYYVDWVAAFDASIAHVGGSYKALKEVRNGKYRDIDQFFNPGTYWRASDRYAPHNVYTSFKNLDALNAKKGYKTSEFTGFSRTDSKPSAEPTATKINITVSSAAYNSQYTYNKKTNTYDRRQGGAPHKDREKGQISPRVVIAMKVKQSSRFEDGWREVINAVGSGTAFIFQDGLVKEVTWKKTSKTSQITFTDKDGKDVPLARGQTWITAVPTSYGGDVSWQ